MVINEKRFPGLVFTMPGYLDFKFSQIDNKGNERYFTKEQLMSELTGLFVSDLYSDRIRKKSLFFVSDSFIEDTVKNQKKLHEILISEQPKLDLSGIYIIKGLVVYCSIKTGKYISEGGYVHCHMHGQSMCFSNNDIVSYDFHIEGQKYYKEINPNLPNNINETIKSLILNVIAFKKYADIQSIEIKGHKNKKIGEVKTANRTPFDITYLDSSWYTEITRSEGFNVNGHFRLQPYKKDGQWTKKLIWINEFRKNGYHRRAKKQIIEENQ